MRAPLELGALAERALGCGTVARAVYWLGWSGRWVLAAMQHLFAEEMSLPGERANAVRAVRRRAASPPRLHSQTKAGCREVECHNRGVAVCGCLVWFGSQSSVLG